MPEKFAIIGTSRTAISNEDFREKLLDGVNQFSRSGKVTSEQWAVFSENIFYESADVNNYETYAGICQRVRGHEQEWNSQPYIIHYLAVAPNLFPVIAGNIAKSKLAEGKDHTRIVIEKPFGRDLESAKALNNLLNEYFKEEKKEEQRFTRQDMEGFAEAYHKMRKKALSECEGDKQKWIEVSSKPTSYWLTEYLNKK